MLVSGVMDHKDSDDKKQTRGLRRPFGAAGLYNITSHIPLFLTSDPCEETVTCLYSITHVTKLQVYN